MTTYFCQSWPWYDTKDRISRYDITFSGSGYGIIHFFYVIYDLDMIWRFSEKIISYHWISPKPGTEKYPFSIVVQDLQFSSNRSFVMKQLLWFQLSSSDTVGSYECLHFSARAWAESAILSGPPPSLVLLQSGWRPENIALSARALGKVQAFITANCFWWWKLE